MWFLTDPEKRDGLSDSFLKDLQERDHFIISNDNDFPFSRRACTLDNRAANALHKRFFGCDFVRTGSRHGIAIAPHVAINYLDDQSASVIYYVGPPDKENRELQFLQDLPMIEAVYFFEDKTRTRLYLPSVIAEVASHLSSKGYEKGAHFVERR